MKRYVVVGLGNFGSACAEALHHQGHEVVVVDQIEAAVDRIAPHVSRAAVGDGRNIEILERIGGRKADAGIVSTGDDIAASILATMALKDLQVADIYVKVISKDHARVMERLGMKRRADLDYADPSYPPKDNPTMIYEMTLEQWQATL